MKNFKYAAILGMIIMLFGCGTAKNNQDYVLGEDEIPSVVSVVQKGQQEIISQDENSMLISYSSEENAAENIESYCGYLAEDWGFNVIDSSGVEKDEIKLYKASASDGEMFVYIDITEENNKYILTIYKSKAILTAEQAVSLLKKCSADALELPADISEYVLIPDDETIDIGGAECYAVNVFADLTERMYNMGVYYVACDGSAIYRFDVMSGEFVNISD